MERPQYPIVVAHKANRYRLLCKYLSMKVSLLEVDVNVCKGRLVLQHGVDFSGFGSVRGEIMKLGYILMEHRDPLWRPMTLEECLRLVQGRAGLWLDLKQRGIAERVVEAVKRYHIRPIVASSAYHGVLRSMKDEYPSIATMLGNVMFRPVDPVGMVEAAGADGISVEYRYVDEELVDTVHEAGFRIAAWTVNNASKVRELADMGCDYIITDVPEKVMKLIGP
ncbi:MAG: hypothetical protein DRK00_10420 [Thermoprotei archaeon]|nr:MAG: hypothetical protein DRK00_10420 [Thermoprotei archaeon]